MAAHLGRDYTFSGDKPYHPGDLCAVPTVETWTTGAQKAAATLPHCLGHSSVQIQNSGKIVLCLDLNKMEDNVVQNKEFQTLELDKTYYIVNLNCLTEQVLTSKVGFRVFTPWV